MIPGAVEALVMLPLGFSLEINVYMLFQPLNGSGLLAMLMINVSVGFRVLMEVDFPEPDSAITNTDWAIGYLIFCSIFLSVSAILISASIADL
jgi:hypothetical protein